MERAQASRKTPLHTSEPCETRTGQEFRAMEVEQFSSLCLWRAGRRARERLVSSEDEGSSRVTECVVHLPLLPNSGRSGAPGASDTYTYDELNRLSTVTDVSGQT